MSATEPPPAPSGNPADCPAPQPPEAGVTLIGGGPVSGESLAAALGFAPRLIAADSGADRALALGHVPERVIGDLNSLREGHRLPGRVERVAEQQTTDFEKCLQRTAAPFILAVGFLGGRVDHTLANLSAILRQPRPVLLLGEEDLAFAAPPSLRLDLVPGARLSLFPLTRVRGNSEGLRWPIGGIDFSPTGAIGTSNMVEGPVRLSFEGPGMVILLEPEALAPALAGLLSAHGG